MSDSIIIKVSDLRSAVQELRRDGIEYIELSISESEEFEGEILPSSLNISGCKFNEPDFWFDYEGVDEIANSKELQDKCLYSPHASSNLL